MKDYRLYIILAILIIPLLVFAGDIEKKRFKESLDGIKEAYFEVEIGMAELTLKAGPKDDLFDLNVTYYPRYFVPEVDVDRDGDEAFVSITSEQVKKNMKDTDLDDHSYDIMISPEVDLRLDMEFGMGDAQLDLTDLKVKRLDIEAGMASLDIKVDKPNDIRADIVSIEAGMGSVESLYLGNLHFNKFSYEGGMSSGELDFRGFEGNADVSLEVGVGSIDVTIPRDVGVKLDYDANFLSSVDLDAFEKRHGYYYTENYKTADSKLFISLDVGLGAVDFNFKK